MSIYACLMTRKKLLGKLKICGRNFLQIWMSYVLEPDKKALSPLPYHLGCMVGLAEEGLPS
jgi:hypothetical protein